MDALGSVARIFRFPVKSMGGEELVEVHVGPHGVVGDREYGVRALDTGRVLSGKREASLMGFSARYEGQTLRITGRDGRLIDEDVVPIAVSDRLGRPVELVRRSAATDVTLEGEPVAARPGEISTWSPPPGTFFDESSLHLISFSSLEALRALEPGADFDPRRFRPNFVIASGVLRGFEEETWVGRNIRIGERLVVRVTKPCSRCVMTTHEQAELPKERSILRTIVRHNSNNAGIRAAVEHEGSVRLGDQLHFV